MPRRKVRKLGPSRPDLPPFNASDSDEHKNYCKCWSEAFQMIDRWPLELRKFTKDYELSFEDILILASLSLDEALARVRRYKRENAPDR